VASRWPQVQEAATQLNGARGFGTGYRIEPDQPAHLACDYAPGRTLAQVLERARAERVPLGIDQALAVLQGVAQALLALHGKNLHHGALSPHSVWISYEGAPLLLDAPFAAILPSLLAKAPALKAALAPYQAPQATEFQRDLFALGALLYELLTLDPLPAAPGIPGALAQATLKAAQEEAALPEALLALLKRLLMVTQPFATAAEFNGTLERALYEGDYSPTTFSLAFLMQTLFRPEQEADALAVKADQGASFAAAPEAPVSPKAKGANRGLLYLSLGGVVVAALFGGLYAKIQQDNRLHQMEQRSLQSRLETLQKEKEANDARLADLAKQEEAQKTLEDLFGKQAEQAPTAGARATAQKDLEAARQKTKDLAKQRADALKEKQKLTVVAAP
jgi:hypothetical protein